MMLGAAAAASCMNCHAWPPVTCLDGFTLEMLDGEAGLPLEDWLKALIDALRQSLAQLKACPPPAIAPCLAHLKACPLLPWLLVSVHAIKQSMAPSWMHCCSACAASTAM